GAPSPACLHVDQLARAVRSGDRSGARPGLVRRRQRRDRRHLFLEDQEDRFLDRSARMVEPARRLYLMPATTPIEHVVIVFKENHGFDNYFGQFPGADGMALPHSPNPPPKDPDHRHPAWLTRAKTAPRVQFFEADIPKYWAWARAFTLCDSYYTDVAGPSSPNHLMVIAADSPITENPHGAPLFDLASLPAQLDAARFSWKNYGGYAFDYIKYTNGKHNATSDQFAVDAAAGKLSTVSWIYADDTLSEHPADTAVQRAAGAGNVTKGMAWTVAQVAAL